MPTKLSPDICYIAGLLNKTRQEEKSMVGIYTTMDDLVENFVEVALRLGVDARKIIIEDIEGTKHVYFYNSKIAKHARELIGKEEKVFKFKNEFASKYLAGMFDASGKTREGRVIISGLTPQDQVMLLNLGIRTRENTILSISALFAMIRGHSILVKNKF